MTGNWKWNSEELAIRYQREYGIDVRPYLRDGDVTLERDEQSGAWMFRGGIPGDGSFYERLHSRDEYYLSEKWEFGEAIRCLVDLPKDARILEIGCGTGAFLDRCRAAGFANVRGVELNQRAVQECRDKGHEVSDRMIERMEATEDSFDCVCAFQVLEHVPDPVEFLRAAASLVSAGGKMILSTPNAESFLGRFKWCLLDLPPHHMSRWDEGSYRKTAELLGLSIDGIKREPLAKYHYRFFANSLVEHLPHGSLRRMVIKPIARLGFAAYPWKASIAGHSILTVMSKAREAPTRHS